MAKAKASSIITTQEKVLPKQMPSIHKPQSPKPKNNPQLEEILMVMMNITTPTQNSSHHPNNNIKTNLNIPITTPISPTWKLYENPFYTSSHHKQQQQNPTIDLKQIHKIHLPISTHKIATSFYDLTFINPRMETELEVARAQISGLKAELACEQKACKKLETLNKRLTRELYEEKKEKKALEGICKALNEDLSSDKSIIDMMKREIEDERKMLRTVEAIREERVQMKLAEAKILLEEKFFELEMVKNMAINVESSSSNGKKDESDHQTLDDTRSTAVIQSRVYREVENHHIKRGIKGFVEFPRVIRAIGCRSSKHLGAKLECQKAQLKLLIKHKGPVTYI